MPVALSIAGSDPSGGAGIQADLKTFHQFGVYGEAVPVLMTVQDTQGVESAFPLPYELVRAQLARLQADIPPAAAKTGALGSVRIIEEIVGWARSSKTPLVVDPVMVSSDGQSMLDLGAVESMARYLLPLCLLVTPNVHEASVLARTEVTDLFGMRRAAERIAELGARNVLIKGGHLSGKPTDLLWLDGEISTHSAERVQSTSTHGTGCTYSAAITALLARGLPIQQAVPVAKRYVTEAIRTAPGLGRGRGPLNHHARVSSDPS